MKKILYILLALLFVGCELDLMHDTEQDTPGDVGGDVGGGGDDGTPDDVPGHPLPSQPIKRRPITPQDKIQRPRFTIISERTVELSFDSGSTPACCSVSFRSGNTGEEYITLVGDDSVVTLPLMDNSSDYTLTIEGDGVRYVEQITIL